MITKKGIQFADKLALDIARTLQSEPPTINYETASKLVRLSTQYALRMESACINDHSDDPKWEKKNDKLERQIEKLIDEIPHCYNVTFSADPRGYCVTLLMSINVSNSWGGPNHYGVA